MAFSPTLEPLYVKAINGSTLNICSGSAIVELTNVMSQDGTINNGVMMIWLPTSGIASINLYVNTVRFGDSSFTLNGINLNIVAYEVDMQSTPVTITLTGANGGSQPIPAPASPGNDGPAGGEGGKTDTTGGPGGPGTVGGNGTQSPNSGYAGISSGNFTLYTQSFINMPTDQAIQINAIGGNGGPGQQGQQGGTGGIGGTGGPGDSGCIANGGPGGPGGPGGNGGPGGTGGTGGAGGNVVIQYLPQTGLEASAFQATVTAGTGGDGGGAGAAGNGGTGGAGGPGACSTYPATCGFDGSQGSQGNPGSPSVNGNQGTNGSAGQTTIGSTTMAVIAENVNFYQLNLLLQTASFTYLTLVGTQESNGYGFIATVCNNISKLYTSLTSPNNYAQSVYYQASQMLLQLQKGLDFFGNPPDYVTLLAYNELNSAVSASLSALAAVETDYNYFLQLNNNQQNALTALNTQYTTASSTITSNQSQMAAIVESANQLAATLDTLNLQVSTSLSQLYTDDTNLLDQIKDTINCPAGAQAVLTGMAMIAFAPATTVGTLAIIGDVIGGLINASNQMDNLNMDGTIVNKQYLIQDLVNTGNQLGNLQEDYSTANSTGLITEADPNGAMLLQVKDQFDMIYNKYLQNMQLATDVYNDFNAYYAAIQARNTVILNYNTYILNYIQLYVQTQSLTALQAQYVAQESSLLNGDLPLALSFLTAAYNNARFNCINQLYLLNKAFNFWSLNNNINVMSQLQGMGDMANVDTAMLQYIQEQLNNDMVKVLSQMGSQPQPFGPVENQDLSPLSYSVSDPNVLKALATTGVTTFTIPTSAPEFAIMSDVRLTLCRLYVEGIQSSSETMLAVGITQMGNETIIGRNNSINEFIHGANFYNFEYNIATQAIQIDAVINTVSMDVSGNSYIFGLIGPFATWQISIPNYTSFDFSQVTALRFDFAGYEYAFTSQESN